MEKENGSARPPAAERVVPMSTSMTLDPDQAVAGPPPSYSSLVIIPSNYEVSDESIFPDAMELSEQSRTPSPHDEIVADAELGETMETQQILTPKACPKTELGLFRNEVEVLKEFRAHCIPWFNGYKDKEEQWGSVLIAVRRLKQQRTGDKLLAYLKNRPISQGSYKLDIPATWDMLKTNDLVDAIGQIKSSDKHSKIHKAYAQMRLFKVVNDKVDGGLVKALNPGEHLSDHLIVINNMAEKKAGMASEKIKKGLRGELKHGYQAGRRWQSVCNWFGGPATVLVLVTASRTDEGFECCVSIADKVSDIGNSFIDKHWSFAQLEVLEYMADFLPSIQGLIERLGEGALEEYCRHGNLSAEWVARISDPTSKVEDGD